MQPRLRGPSRAPVRCGFGALSAGREPAPLPAERTPCERVTSSWSREKAQIFLGARERSQRGLPETVRAAEPTPEAPSAGGSEAGCVLFPIWRTASDVSGWPPKTPRRTSRSPSSRDRWTSQGHTPDGGCQGGLSAGPSSESVTWPRRRLAGHCRRGRALRSPKAASV